MFWGSATPKKASGNLRTAIYSLKAALSELRDDVLRADLQAVSLRPGAIRPEPGPLGGPGFLEGLDLTLVDCEPFEDWLRDMRSEPEPPARIVPAVDAPALHLATAPDHVALGLLPTLHSCLPDAARQRTEAITDGVARFVAAMTRLDIHDLRHCNAPVMPLPLEDGRGATHFLRASVAVFGRRQMVTYRLYEGAGSRLVWVSDPFPLAQGDQSDLVPALAEIVLDRIARTKGAELAPDFFPWTAITALFSMDADQIQRTERTLDRLIEEGGSPDLHCIKAFAQVFKTHEGLGPLRGFTAEGLVGHLADLPERHPLLPLCQSLIGYSVHMLCGENDLADLILEDSYRRAPQLSLNLDHLAVVRLMRGDLAGADRAFRQCQRVGASSPWRYTYDVTGAMLGMARGDYREALTFANRALLRKPRFIGALRYAMAGFALSDNPRDAARMHARIQRLRPDHDLSDWMGGLLRRAPQALGPKLAQSLKTHGLL